MAKLIKDSKLIEALTNTQLLSEYQRTIEYNHYDPFDSSQETYYGKWELEEELLKRMSLYYDAAY